MFKALDQQVWDTKEWEQVLLLKGQRRCCQVFDRIPEEARQALDSLKEESED